MAVHNHGPNEGRGVDCHERLVGDCIYDTLTPAPAAPELTLMRRTLVELHRILDGERPDAAQIVAQYTREAEAAAPAAPRTTEEPSDER